MTTLSSKEIDVILGDFIRQHRRAAGLSQSELGRAAGISFQQIQKYECGQNRISVSRLFQLVAALGLDPAEIVTEVQRAIESHSAPAVARIAVPGH